ncbi:Antitoxin HigA-1 [Poriferisphaera corsica]|uniref:Antitoxin HigA-1 n=1 Tax=Poriferisphaera corsica TaxID=2528020 RepID=A0A517YU77_9BACT|nr:HigA family addiction module antitoxin [Poriferisphaera corsica]QDU33769.1 Antitoxin HigA-1 [Poriferisphaera corsica]
MAKKKKKQKDPSLLIHPGEILKSEFLDPMGISMYRLAKSIGVPQTRISNICLGRTSITADTALRLGKFFNMEPEFWSNLQTRYEFDLVLIENGDMLDGIETYQAA